MISVSGRIDESVFIGEGVVITGRVSIGKDSNVWHNAVLRAEHGGLRLCDGTHHVHRYIIGSTAHHGRLI